MSEHAGNQSAAPGMFRVGIVQEQDVARARVRVVFPDYDQLRSWWLPIVVPKSQNDKAYWIPDLGEQVVCLMDAHDEAGAVLGAIYSSADTAPVASADKWHLGFSDGAAFEYDRSAHVLELGFSDGASMKYDGGAHLLELGFADGASIKYDGGAHALAVALPSGATLTLSAGAASIAIDSLGNAQVISAAQIQLGTGQLKGVARLGDQVTCPAGIGSITSASLIVEAQ
ncbi:MAG TPA: phage baseplate assembly protein V [Candidatus Binataceae bacterium]|nr:phage baseplate assembly protein V [Candidatus Binataceae bacterium]